MSLSATGWAQLHDGDLEDLGVIKTKPVEGHLRIARMAGIVDDVGALLDTVDLVAIEGYSYASATSALYSGELGGILRLRLETQQVPWLEIPPGTWRKAALGRGNMPKDICRIEILKRYRVEHPDMNALEAFGVAIAAHLQQTGGTMPPIRRAA
jgi:Holliday junction resolvasome RuvABC endonuclease subunit